LVTAPVRRYGAAPERCPGARGTGGDV